MSDQDPQLTSEPPVEYNESASRDTQTRWTAHDTNNSISQAGTNVNSEIERLEAMSLENEPITVEEAKKATGFGEYGAKVVADLANSDGMTFSRARDAVKNAYMAGFTNLDSSKVNFETETQINAFTAGKQDRLMQDTSAKENAKTATVYDGEVVENKYFKKLSPADQEQHHQIAKDLGLSMDFVDRLVAGETIDGEVVEANAQHEDGKYTRSDSSENKAHIDVVHEALHRMKQVAPVETGELIDAIYEMAETSSGVADISVIDSVKSEHDDAGISMDTSDYLEEIAAREIPKFFDSPEAWNAWRKKLDSDPSLRSKWERFVDFLKEVIEKAKRFLSQIGMTAEQKANANKKIAQLERIKELYGKAYKASRNAVAEIAQAKNLQNNSEVNATTEYNGTVSNSLKKTYWHTDLTKNQIKLVEEWIGKEGNPEAKKIIDTAYWYKGRINGQDLFVIYSTEDSNGPTILYEKKGPKAKTELNILQKALEVIDNERSPVEKSRIVNELFVIGDRMQKKHNLANNDDRLGERGSNT
ncbi:MAG: hypothetical protein IJ391_07785, partial [Clostridia bacterium]|nr:hypothetical protein [Clostridia bacterium]